MIETGFTLLAACIIPIIKHCITDVGVESDILEAGATTAIKETFSIIAEKFQKSTSNAEKLEKILNDEFEVQNRKYDDLFSDALTQIINGRIKFHSMDEMKIELSIWSRNCPNYCRNVSYDMISSFVNDFFKGVRNRINRDDELNKFISIMNIKTIVADIKNEQTSIINMLEKIITKIETSEKTAYSNNANKIENTGDNSEFENIKQTGNNSNTIINSGNGSVFKGITQG